MKSTHFIKGDKTICGITPTDQDTKSFIWFNGMKHKCKKCANIIEKNKMKTKKITPEIIRSAKIQTMTPEEFVSGLTALQASINRSKK